MMMKTFAAALAILPLVAGHSANARDRQQIVAPVLAKYNSVWSAKRSLLKAAKKHANLSGEEYYTLAVTCEVDQPASASIILTLIHKADCKEKVPDFFVEAGNHGVPEGFAEAGKRLAEPTKALFFADIAYLVSGNDPALQAEADREIRMFGAQLPQGRAQAKQIEVAATHYAQQRVASHVYASLADLSKRPSAALPDLSRLLTFADAKRCTRSHAANQLLDDMVNFDATEPRPATVRVPGIAKPVRSRLTRLHGDSEGQVDAELDFKGQWLGLTVLGLSDTFTPESDGAEIALRFAEPVSVVAPTLRRAGFLVDPTGKDVDQIVKDKDDSQEEVEVYTSVFANPKAAETLFTCDAEG